MPEHTETLREIAESLRREASGLQASAFDGGKAFAIGYCADRLEKLLSEADVDLVKKWRNLVGIYRRAIVANVAEQGVGAIADERQECANELETWLAVNLPRIKDDARTEQDAKWTAALGFSGILGPETIAKQVAHEKAEARLEEMKWLWQQDFVDAYNGGLLTEKGRNILRERIASLAKGAGQ